MTLDLTADRAELAAAAADVVRLLPSRMLDPVLAGLLVQATAEGVLLAGTDRERSVRISRPAVVHTEGRVLVPAKVLAETLNALESPEVRLVVEGSRLAIRAPGARFALPLLDVDSHPGVPEPPAVVGEISGALLAASLVPVAAAASKDDALPMFTGIRLRARGDRLVAIATDRYRLAVAEMPWQPADPELDVMVPAGLLAEVAKQAKGAQRVTLHADGDRAGLAWTGATVTTALLASSLPDENKLLPSTVDCSVEVEVEALAGAVRRVSPYAGPRATLALEVGDGELRVRGADPQSGEAEELVKATVHGDRVVRHYQARYLTDALRWFSGTQVRLDIQPGIRGTLLSVADPARDEVKLRYLVVPLRMQGS